jgi:thiol-disulfide isomerase/thioredoxin
VGHERAVLVFVSSTCGPCISLFPELSRWKDMLVGRLGIHVIGSGDDFELRRISDDHGLPILHDAEEETTKAYGIRGTPAGVEIDASGAIATAPAMGGPAIEGLIRAALKRPDDGEFELVVRRARASH